MNGIKMSDCKFYVNEEERVVVCIIPYTRRMLLDYVREHFDNGKFSLYYGIDSTFEESLELPPSFMGKAVCAKEDEWNEETGRMIAFSRAKDKCYKAFFRRATLLIHTIDDRLGKAITMFNEFGEKLYERQQALEAQIEERISKE